MKALKILFFLLFFVNSLNAAEVVDGSINHLIREARGDSDVSKLKILEFAASIQEKHGVVISFSIPGNPDLSGISKTPMKDSSVPLPFGIIDSPSSSFSYRERIQLIYLQLLYIDEGLSRVQDRSEFQGLEFVIMADSKSFDDTQDGIIALKNADALWACSENFRIWKELGSIASEVASLPFKEIIGDPALPEAIYLSLGGVPAMGFSTGTCFVGDIVRLVSRPTGLSNPPKYPYIFTSGEILAYVKMRNLSVFDTAAP